MVKITKALGVLIITTLNNMLVSGHVRPSFAEVAEEVNKKLPTSESVSAEEIKQEMQEYYPVRLQKRKGVVSSGGHSGTTGAGKGSSSGDSGEGEQSGEGESTGGEDGTGSGGVVPIAIQPKPSIAGNKPTSAEISTIRSTRVASTNSTSVAFRTSTTANSFPTTTKVSNARRNRPRVPFFGELSLEDRYIPRE